MVCSRYVQGMYKVYTWYVQGMCKVCTRYVHGMYKECVHETERLLAAALSNDIAW